MTSGPSIDEVPLLPDRSALMRMATGYLARYAAPTRRLRLVLARRIARWCAANGAPPPSAATMAAAIEPIVAKLVELGLVDDEALAASRSRSLARKGLAPRRIRATLRHQGLAGSDLRDEAGETLDEATQADRFARRKRLGPFRIGERTPFRDKDLRALLRAGFSPSVAIRTVDAEPDDIDAS